MPSVTVPSFNQTHAFLTNFDDIFILGILLGERMNRNSLSFSYDQRTRDLITRYREVNNLSFISSVPPAIVLTGKNATYLLTARVTTHKYYIPLPIYHTVSFTGIITISPITVP